jgi:hypothetical protein
MIADFGTPVPIKMIYLAETHTENALSATVPPHYGIAAAHPA